MPSIRTKHFHLKYNRSIDLPSKKKKKKSRSFLAMLKGQQLLSGKHKKKLFFCRLLKYPVDTCNSKPYLSKQCRPRSRVILFAIYQSNMSSRMDGLTLRQISQRAQNVVTTFIRRCFIVVCLLRWSQYLG